MKPEPLTPDQIGEFFEETKNRRRPYTAPPDAFQDEVFWAQVAAVLDVLEKQHPWKVRRVRGSFRWLFRRVHFYQKEGRWT